MTYSISAIDGRYQNKVEELGEICSEFGLVKYRLEMEVAWLQFLAKEGILPEGADLNGVEKLRDNFEVAEYERLKEIEGEVNHDVKAVEYLLREHSDEALWPYLHLMLTSEDVNNIAYAMMLRDARGVVTEALQARVIDDLSGKAKEWKGTAMLSRTHGQPATPTTMGKELAVYVRRFSESTERIEAVALKAKCNGATGNFAVHTAAYPEKDWLALGEQFVTSLGLSHNPLTTQIESHDHQAVLLNELGLLCSVMSDLCTDVWGYISIGYFGQKKVEGEVGSSTMPHKVNPIDFENARGNAKLARGVARTLADELPVSMWQRDLSDSTLQRNFGLVFGHLLLAIKNLEKGLGKLELREEKLAADLEANPEVLTEAVQTVLRKNGHADAYEQLKALSRGQSLTLEAIREFIQGLEIDEADKTRLLELTPATYTGHSEALVDTYLS